jgi:N-acyl-D-amino-acid deacylase
MKRLALIFASTIAICVCGQNSPPSTSPAEFDVLIKGGTVYDGTGGEPLRVDLAIRKDHIAGIGDFKTAKGKVIVLSLIHILTLPTN